MRGRFSTAAGTISMPTMRPASSQRGFTPSAWKAWLSVTPWWREASPAQSVKAIFRGARPPWVRACAAIQSSIAATPVSQAARVGTRLGSKP
ncbi:hypothetical protein D9M68_590550 [compost metagenome]